MSADWVYVLKIQVKIGSLSKNRPLNPSLSTRKMPPATRFLKAVFMAERNPQVALSLRFIIAKTFLRQFYARFKIVFPLKVSAINRFERLRSESCLLIFTPLKILPIRARKNFLHI